MDTRSVSERLGFKISEIALLLVEALVLGYLIGSVTRSGSQMQSDNSTKITFTCLSLSLAFFTMYEGYLYIMVIAKLTSDPETQEDIAQWEANHETLIRISLALLRHAAYLLNNLGFAFNIARWQRILREASHDPLEVAIYVRRRLIIAVTLLVIVSVIFCFLQMSNNLNPDAGAAFYII
jgi:hypothetical protein